MGDKVFVGGGKEIGQYGNISIGLRYKDLKPNEKGYVNLIVAKRKEPSERGETHYVYINDYVPGNRKPGPRQEFPPDHPMHDGRQDAPPPRNDAPSPTDEDLAF